MELRKAPGSGEIFNYLLKDYGEMVKRRSNYAGEADQEVDISTEFVH